MNIILVGPDGSGKSTLAHALGEALRYAIVHTQWEMFGRNKIQEAYGFEHMMLVSDNHIIMDRHTALESMAYRKHFSYEVPTPKKPYLDVFSYRHNLLVYLTYDPKEIAERKGDDEHIHMIKTVHQDFESTLQKQGFRLYGTSVSRPTYVTVDTTEMTVNEAVHYILSHIPVEHLTKAPDRGFSKSE